MTTVELFGRINEAGDLEIGQPHGLPAGAKVRVVITELDDEQQSWEEAPWTEQEFKDLLKPDEPKTGAEIAAWLRANPDTSGWAALDIPDAAEWVRELRRQSSARHAQG